MKIYNGLVKKKTQNIIALMSPSSPVSSLTPSSGTSEDLDHQEIQLALQDAKMAARNKIRSRFHSSSDLIHRLFVCISGKTCRCITFPPTSLPLLFSYPWCFSGAMQVLQISSRPTMLVTFAASSRLCSKSWQPSVSRVMMISKRKVRNASWIYVLRKLSQFNVPKHWRRSWTHVQRVYWETCISWFWLRKKTNGFHDCTNKQT